MSKNSCVENIAYSFSLLTEFTLLVTYRYLNIYTYLFSLSNLMSNFNGHHVLKFLYGSVHLFLYKDVFKSSNKYIHR